MYLIAFFSVESLFLLSPIAFFFFPISSSYSTYISSSKANVKLNEESPKMNILTELDHSYHESTSSFVRLKRNSQCPNCGDEDDEGFHRKNCTAEREERKRLVKLTGTPGYIPKCRRNGSYASVQCHRTKQVCWCVSINGEPITGSTVLNSKPDCMSTSSNKRKNRNKNRKDKKDQKDSGSFIHRRSSKKRAKNRNCSHKDKASFNSDLVGTFRSEFNRIRSLTPIYEGINGNDDFIVLSWKFDQLDRNRDGYLTKNETDNLKRLVKLQIGPRVCANRFIPECAKKDKRITKIEWNDCLRINEMIIKNLDSRSRASGNHHSSTPQFKRTGGDDGNDSLIGNGPAPILKNTSPLADSSNCWTDRQLALSSQRLEANVSLIIPECTPDGRYEKMQCTYDKSYCWCVNEATGKEIPDSITVNSVTNCDKLMKGCLGKKKENFLGKLNDLFIRKMSQILGTKFQDGSGSNSTIRDQAITWNFLRFDSNKNNVLDRREWKSFKNEIIAFPKLRKCGKKFPRHCDVNRDRKITLAEWTTCTQLKQKIVNNTNRRAMQRSSGQPRRIGKNPFTTILQRRK